MERSDAETCGTDKVPLLGRGPKPRGILRQTSALLTPRAISAAQIMAERGVSIRLRRLRDAASDSLRQRLRRTRPRMRALVLAPGGRLIWRSVPAPPAPGPLGAVVHPLAMATCDMDRPIGLGRTPFPLPLRFGHECVAEVLSVGADVKDIRPGQRVVVPFQINCGSCRSCVAGQTANCLNVPPISMYGFGMAGGHWGGTLADELAVPFADAMLVPLPDGVDPIAAASVADNVSDAYRHVAPYLPNLLAQDPNAAVLILAGVGRRPVFTPSVALYAGQIAQALGARNVTLVDGRPGVRSVAHRLGLSAIRPAEVRGHAPAPLVIDATTEPRGHMLALSFTAADGICSNAGSLHLHAKIPIALMYGRNVTLRVARAHARTHIPEVLALMADGGLRPEHVTTIQAPLEDAREALEAHLAGHSIKTVLTA